MLRNVLIVFLTVPLFTALKSQEAPTLTLPQIMQGTEFVGASPGFPSWSEDSKKVYFSWNPEHKAVSDTYVYHLETETLQVLSDSLLRELPRTGGDYSRDYRWKVYEHNSDIYWRDLNSGQTKALMKTTASEGNPRFSGDEQSIVFEAGDNLFSWNIQSGTTQQLTHFIKGAPRKEPQKSDAQDQWLKDDQLAYFEILRERDQEDTYRKDRREQLQPEKLHEIYLKGARLSNLQISPDLRFVSYRLEKEPGQEKGTQVPDYVTATGYVRDLSARGKVGSPQSTYQSWLYDRNQDTTYQIDPKQIPGIYDKPDYLKDYLPQDSTWKATYEKPRSVLIHGPFFSDNSTYAVVVVRSQDNKDRWIMRLDPETAELHLLDRQRDEAWVGGPGISNYNFSAGSLGWMADNETIWFHSEETGYSHLYAIHVPSGKKEALTSGNFEVLNAQLSRDKTQFFLTTNEKDPAEHQVYVMNAGGGKRVLLNNTPGNHQAVLSPDEKYLAVRYSYSNKPWELYLMENRRGAELKPITRSQTEAFQAYPWREPEIVEFEARDGEQVRARLYRPDTPTPQGPAVIFVHGAGYLQNVHKWWSSYYREYMFHNFLVDQGYTVLDIDYRGSAGYGRDWRVGIYRFMGGKDLDDQVDGAKFLTEKYDVSPNRIGIYGGSYGGFITLMALFTAPGTFKCGAALRSVTDWAHYNHPYTSNILNTPVQDSIAFRKSSPIYHAENLQGHLLMLHGMVDRNVQFQDVVRLSQRLIELGKDDWELAVFPMEGHGFVESSSWADEYKRIFKLFETHLK